MYTDPLIAGTNKRHIWCVLAMRWRTVTAIDHLLLILPRINNWCLNMIYHNGISAEVDLTNEDEERLVTLHWLINIEKVELVKSHRFCDIDFKEVVIWSLIVRLHSCDWRCRRISRWAGFREKRRWSDEYLSRRRWSEIVAKLATCPC